MISNREAGIEGALGNRPEGPIAVKNAVQSTVSSVISRLKRLGKGGKKDDKRDAPPVNSYPDYVTGALDIEKDWRVRLTAPPNGPFGDFGDFFKDINNKYLPNILSPLRGVNGVVFPYTPTIQMSHAANYTPLSPTHSNYQSHFYTNSQVSNITITADFTAQDQEQARYVLAAIYFFRAATKMFYGQSNNQGNPPPIMYLDGYGSYYLPHVPVVVSSFSHTMPGDVDYVTCELTATKSVSVTRGINLGGAAPAIANSQRQSGFLASYAGVQETVQQTIRGHVQRIPTMSTITLELLPMYSRRNVSENFSWERFSKGELLRGRGGFL